jgi:putative lipoic acid-binding regulatory protein
MNPQAIAPVTNDKPPSPVPEKPLEKPLIEYPTRYAFKVMGRHDSDFRGYVRALFSEVLGVEVGDDAITQQTSSRGTYLSLTVSVWLESEEHRQRVYLSLHGNERIVYYL